MIEGLIFTDLAIEALLPDDAETAGTMAAPATAVAICDVATTQNCCDARMIADPSTMQMPGKITHARL